MTFPFAMTVGIEAEVESIVPDGEGNIEVTLSANGRTASVYYDAAKDDHGTLQDALLWLVGYQPHRVRQKAWQPAPHESAGPQLVM